MYSVQRVVSDGSLQVVDLSFYYFDRSEIAVYINSELYTDWQWASDVEDRIIFNEPIPAGIEVLIKRTTDLSKLRHYFSKGSAFTAEALDEDLQQVLHIAQEATEASLVGDFYTDIDMHGHRVRNIGPAVDDSDALTLRQYKQDAQGAFVARNQAEQFKNEAASYAGSAQTSANNSAASAQDSLAAAGSAQTYAANAAASASAAAQSEANAAASAAAAANSFDAFDDRYLGAKPSDPVTDNDGNALQVGALYWNTAINEMRVWNGSSWQVAVGSLVGNADTATKLQTARTINGTSFDGSADITTAKWGTARTLTIGNTGKVIDGSADVSWSLAEIGGDASLTNYTPAGTGAVARTVQDKLREVVSVKDFGAVGDGVTDDTAAIQAAVNTGKAVYFPAGIYLISGSINLAGGSLYGNCDATIKRKQTSGNNTQLIIATSLSNFEIKGINIEGGYISGGYTNNISATNGENGAGISLISCSNVTISKCNISNVWGDCVFVYSTGPSYVAPTNITVQDCVLHNPFRGAVTSTHCVGLYVLRNSIYKPIPYVNSCILMEPNTGTPQTITNLVVSHNKCNSVTGFVTIINVGGTLSNPINDVLVSNNSVQGIGIFSALSPGANGISIVNNTLTNTPLLTRSNTFMDMFSIVGASNIYISNNKMLQADGSSVAYVTDHLVNCTGVVVTGNIWQSKINIASPNDPTVGLVNRSYLNVNNCNDCIISNNIFHWRPTVDINGTAPINFRGTSSVNPVVFVDNELIGFYGVGLRIDASFSNGVLQIKNNIFRHAISTVFPIIVFADNPKILISGNTFTSGRSNNVYLDTGVTQPVLGATEIRASVKTGYATAAPTTGSWGKGSIVWNINPSAGGTPGWVCVADGTPGTWKAMSNLAT